MIKQQPQPHCSNKQPQSQSQLQSQPKQQAASIWRASAHECIPSSAQCKGACHTALGCLVQSKPNSVTVCTDTSHPPTSSTPMQCVIGLSWRPHSWLAPNAPSTVPLLWQCATLHSSIPRCNIYACVSVAPRYVPSSCLALVKGCGGLVAVPVHLACSSSNIDQGLTTLLHTGMGLITLLHTGIRVSTLQEVCRTQANHLQCVPSTELLMLTGPC